MKKYTRSDFSELIPFSETDVITIEEIEKHFSEAEIETIKLGHSADSMDEKWCIFCEEDIVHFFRSWTGKEFCRFRIDGKRIYEIIVDNKFNPDKPMTETYIRKAIPYVIDAVLLGKRVSF